MHLYQLPSGTWRAIVKHRGRRRTVTAPTRGEAYAKGAQLVHELGGIPRESPTVEDLVVGHLAAVELSPTTRADYQSVLNRMPGPFLERKVADVRPRIVEALYRQLADTGMSPHRIGRVHDLLRVAWKRAIRYEWATVNPVAAVQPPSWDTAEIHPPTPEQVARRNVTRTSDLVHPLTRWVQMCA